MELSSDLLSQFAKITKNDSKPNTGVIVNGTAVEYSGTIYVRLDGSDQLTPIISSTSGIKNGDRVTVLIKDHSATVTGNTSSPSAGADDIEGVKTEIGNKITEVEILIADKVDTIEFNAEKARIDELVADNVTIKGELNANSAKVGELEADNVVINEKLTAQDAKIENLDVTKIDADIADLKYATVERLEATDANIHNLEADYGAFKVLSTDKFTANEAAISDLEVNKLDASEAELKYANIDFANIEMAAVEQLFSKAGIIGDLVVGDSSITGTLVGVTIKGDLIEGGTVKADKLVVQGEDGLYYKLNVTAETVAAEQTEYNSLNGSIITAKSITAEKVNVNDLVAFGATIGGFKITADSLYSGSKSSVDNTTRGVFMGDDGQFAVGDASNYLKFFKDTDGTYKLAISASSIVLKSTGANLDTIASDSIIDQKAQFYLSTSPTSLAGGSWSNTQPQWQEGHYIWMRLFITRGNGKTEYSPSENGYCVSGNTGPKGDAGESVTVTSNVVDYQSSTSGTVVPTGTWSTSIPTVAAGSYLWTRIRVTYSDGKTTTSYSVSRQGSDGSDGSGVTVKSTAITYAASTNGTTAPGSGWQSTIPSVSAGRYLWTKTVVTYSDGKSTTAYSVSRHGQNGSDGKDGTSVSISSTSVTYQASTSGTAIPTGSWTTSIPSVSAGRYLWTKTVVNYSDGKSTTSYSVGRMGQNGSNGDDGRGIKSTSITYQAGTSQTSAPTGSWSTSVPTLTTALPYLWTRTIVTYTDNTTTTSYSVSSTLESFEVGGRNYFKRFPNIINDYYCEIDSNYESELKDYQNIGSFGQFYNLAKPMSYFVGKKIKLTFDCISPNGETPITVYNKNFNARYLISASGIKSPISSEWIHQEIDLTVTDKGESYDESASNKIEIYCKDKMGCRIRNIKFEIGNKATDWTPAPEDQQAYTDAQITVAKDEITSEVSRTYLTKNEGESMYESTSTKLTQMSDEFLFEFDRLESDYGSKFQDISKYIRFVDGDIILGEVGNDLVLKIQNDRISFLESNVEVAYLSNHKLYITDSEIVNRMDIGNFAWYSRSNGNMTLRFIG